MRRLSSRLLDLLGSYGLAVAVLSLLLLLTLFGTLEQRYASIYDVQGKYFESLLLTELRTGEDSTFPILLPGGYLLLALLGVNLVVGGILRVRKSLPTLLLAAGTVLLLAVVLPSVSAGAMFIVAGLVTLLLLVVTGWAWPQQDWGRLGVLVVHGGIVMLLAAGLVEFYASDKGTLALAEADGGPYRRAGDEFESYYEWDLVLAEHLADGRVRERVVPFERFEGLEPGQSARFEDPALPFDLRISGFQRNCVVVAEPQGGVEGLALRRLPPDREKAERNAPGMLVTLVEKGPSARTSRGLVHAEQSFPWRVSVGREGAGQDWDVDLRRRRWSFPFTLRLEEFTAAYHPGTTRPKEYSSRVTKLEDGSSEPILVTMNQPLRHKGYTFFQSSFEPSREVVTRDGRRVRTPPVSIFSVVRNPADAWPLTACGIVMVGLAYMMIVKLARHLRAERGRARA
ncbi:MAG: cytochrome c biogenesis protein ResB [Planctomycetia bacterium]